MHQNTEERVLTLDFETCDLRRYIRNDVVVIEEKVPAPSSFPELLPYQQQAVDAILAAEFTARYFPTPSSRPKTLAQYKEDMFFRMYGGRTAYTPTDEPFADPDMVEMVQRFFDPLDAKEAQYTSYIFDDDDYFRRFYPLDGVMPAEVGIDSDIKRDKRRKKGKMTALDRQKESADAKQAMRDRCLAKMKKAA